MTISTLDAHTALIVVDLQKGVVSLPCAHPMDAVVERATALIDAFRRHDLPVVLVNAAGIAPGRTEQPRRGEFAADWADLIPELNARPQDIYVTKRTWGSFNFTDLEARLRQRHVTQVVVVGVATSIGVESTARQAYELGFNVAVATDAMTDLNADAHLNSVERIFPRLGETGSAQDIIDRLGARG